MRAVLAVLICFVGLSAQTQVNVTVTIPCPTGAIGCIPSTATGALTLLPRVLLLWYVIPVHVG